MTNGLDSHRGRASVHSRSSRGSSGGTRPQSMFEPRDQERLSQKLNKVRILVMSHCMRKPAIWVSDQV